MPVNNYLKDCKYSLNNLDNYIYLYQFNEPILNFITDDGESNATATSIKGSSQRLYCNSVQYQSTTSIDNRFAFDNTLTVTLSEHSKVSHYSIIQTLLNGNWMVVFKNTDGDAFVVNAEYPVMVSYSYVINDEKTPNNLTITFRALQNVPTVNLKGSVAFSSTLCDNYCEYNISRIETLKMIDMNKATIDVDNDGFSLTEIGEGNLKTIEFNPTSMSFTDSFDGREFSQTLTFQIPFDSYRYYFHYNLLEFLDNRYYALIKTTDDNNILGGFRQGLFPSYTISTADNSNVITITLNAKYTNYSVLGSDTMSTTTNDGMFYKPVMGECVDKLYVWTLIEQYNANGIATNGYYCLSGFEDIYNDYTILGTYDKYDTRFGFKLIDYNIDCSEGCKINNLPSSIQFENSGETKCYTLDTTCSIVWEWNSTAIDFTYDEITKEMCVISKVDEGTFNIKATTTDGTIQYATVVIGNGGITGDTTTTINITAEGQRVTVIPVKGMSNVKSLTSSLQYQVNQNGNGYEVTVPENTREETKTYTITILYKDNSIETVSIIQERIYYIITSSEETECYGQNLYYVNKKYKKYTENGELIFIENIKGNQKETDSVICLDFDEKVSGCTNCFEGFVYTLYEYKKNGSTIATRYEKTTSSCTNNASTEYVVNTEKAKCVDGTEYYVEEMYGANCNGGNNVKLYPVIERTSIVEATDSNVCDVIDPNASGGTLYRWVDTNETYCLTNTAQTNCTSSTTNTYCDGYNLFEQTTYYVDALCNGNWVQSGNTQTILKEENSTICGYVEPEEPEEQVYSCYYEKLKTANFNSITIDSTSLSTGIFYHSYDPTNNYFIYSNRSEEYSKVVNLSNGDIATMEGFPYYLDIEECSNHNYIENYGNDIVYRDTNVFKTLFFNRDNTKIYKFINNSFQEIVSAKGDDPLVVYSTTPEYTYIRDNNYNDDGVFYWYYKINNNNLSVTQCEVKRIVRTEDGDLTSNYYPTELVKQFDGIDRIKVVEYGLYERYSDSYSNYYFNYYNGNEVTFKLIDRIDNIYLSSDRTYTRSLTSTILNTKTVSLYSYNYYNCLEEGIYYTYHTHSSIPIYDFNNNQLVSNNYSVISPYLNMYIYSDKYNSFFNNQFIVDATTGTQSSTPYIIDEILYINAYGIVLLQNDNNDVYIKPYTQIVNEFNDYMDGLQNKYMEIVITGSVQYYYNSETYTATTANSVNNGDGTYTYLQQQEYVTHFGLKTKTNLIKVNRLVYDEVQYLDELFSGCAKLTSVEFGEYFNTSNVTNMSYMFENCYKLTNIDFTYFNTSNVNNMNSMFRGCSGLTSLDVSSWDVGDHIINKNGVFNNCTSLRTLRIKQGTRDWWYARLTDASIQNNVTITEV